MTQESSAPALIQLVHRYYPAGIASEDPRYNDSAEARRLSVLLEAAMEDTSDWDRFVQRVGESFAGCEVREQFLIHEPSHRCEVLLPEMKSPDGKEENAVGCMLSLLAPVYAIYATHEKEEGLEKEYWRRFPPLPPEFQAHEAKLARLIESTFGFTRLPNDVLFTLVPDLKIGMEHRGTRLLDCLF